MIDLTGYKALVTGGGQGVGQAISMVLARQGADIAVADISANHAQQVAEDVKALGRQAMALETDVADRQSVMFAVERVIAEWGQVDVLVNNAGVVTDRNSKPGDVEAVWNRVLQVNVMGVVNCTDAVMPHMAKRRFGKIVNIASTAGKPGDPIARNSGPAPEGTPPPLGGSAYAASKAAVIRSTQISAASAARFNINVNCVCPSRMITPMGLAIAMGRNTDMSPGEIGEQRRLAVLQVNRFGRELEPVDIGNAVAFLVSEEARNITGVALNVDGGFKMT